MDLVTTLFCVIDMSSPAALVRVYFTTRGTVSNSPPTLDLFFFPRRFGFRFSRGCLPVSARSLIDCTASLSPFPISFFDRPSVSVCIEADASFFLAPVGRSPSQRHYLYTMERKLNAHERRSGVFKMVARLHNIPVPFVLLEC